MQMTKKVLSVVLAVLMVVSMMSVMAVTAGAATYDGVADGYYVLSEDNGWTPGTALKLNTAYTGSGSEYMGVIDTTANAQYKIAYIQNGEANFWAPAGPNATFDGDYTGKSIIYFKTVNNSWSFKKGTVETEDELKLAASVGGDWKVADSFTSSSVVTLPAGKTMNLDLNGKTVTFSVEYGFANKGTLNVSDSSENKTGKLSGTYGTIDNYGAFTLNSGTIEATAAASQKKVVIWSENNANTSVTINGGTINGTFFGIKVATGTFEMNGGTINAPNGAVILDGAGVVGTLNGGTINAKDGVTVWKTATANITGGTINATNICVSGNGTSGQGGYTINISGGTLVSAEVGVYHPNNGTLNISNGASITGQTAVYAKAGTTNITGGTLTATGAKAAFAHNGNGCNATGDAVVVETCDYPGGVPTVTISGGTFETADGTGGAQLGAYTYREQDQVSVTIDGVTLDTAYGDDQATFVFANGGAIDDIDVDDDYKVVTKDNGDKEVVAKNYVAQVGSTKYESLAEAFTNVADGGTVTVLADTTLANVDIPAGKTVTLDCADKTVTVTPWSFSNHGTLTVTGTSGGLTGEKGLVDNYGTLNIAGGVHSTSLANPAFWNNYDGNVINVTGGTINAAGTAIVNDNGTTNISAGTINGMVILDESDVAGQTAVDAVNFTGGTINGSVVVQDADAAFTMSGDAAITRSVAGNAVEITAGTANLNGGSITCTGAANGVYIVGSDSALNVDGATISNENNFCISSNGTAGNEGFDITINSGTFTSGTDAAVFMPQAGTLEINGGTFTGVEALYIKSGTVTINDGTFVSTANHTDFEHTGNGTKDTGDVIFVENCNYPGGAPVVTINGGTFTPQGEGTYAVAAYSYDDQRTEVTLDNVTVPSAYGVADSTFNLENGATITNITPAEGCSVVEDAQGNKTIVSNDVAEVNGVKYATFQEARNAVKTAGSGTIKILKDFELDGYYGIFGDCTIDLAGHTITGTNNMFQVKSGADLTIAGPGTLDAGAYTAVCVLNGGSLDVKDGAVIKGGTPIYNLGTTTITDGDITASGTGNTGIWNEGGATLTIEDGTITVGDDSWGVVVREQGTSVTMNGGEIVTGSGSYGISGIGNSYDAGYSITVNGGKVQGGSLGIYHPNDGTLVINGGEISGETGVYVKSGDTQVTISGGTIKGTGTATAYDYNGNGGNPTGDALVVDNCGYPGGAPGVQISGGTFISDNAKPVGSYNTVTAGKPETETPIQNFISGGSFNKPVDKDLCTVGYEPTTTVDPQTGMYTVELGNNPLDALEKDDTNKVITAAAAQALDLNEFGLPGGLEYKVASILGVQKKSKIATDVAGEGLRFVAQIDTETAKNCDDYGFLFTKVSGDNISTANFGNDRFAQYLTIDKAGQTCTKKSCKDSTCTVVDGNFGDPSTNNAKYSYVTAAVTGVSAGKGVAAVFYVTIGNNTYYANYTGTPYYGICSPDPSKLS